MLFSFFYPTPFVVHELNKTCHALYIDSQNTQLTVDIKNAEGGYPSLYTSALSLQLWLTAFKAHANLGKNNLIKAESLLLCYR